MTASIIADNTCYAGVDRTEDWRKCCAVAMGFEWVDRFEDDDQAGSDNRTQFKPIQQVINLLDDDEDDFDEIYDDDCDKKVASKDQWIENARRLQGDLARMTLWIRSKQYAYVSVDMPEDEASLIQSTVTSFAATTASELETLRKMIPSNTASNIASHRAGVVQLLLNQLKEQVAQPFGVLQQQRTRVAVQLWQNPLQCKLYQPRQIQEEQPNGNMMQLFDEEDSTEREQRFLPRRAAATETHQNFLKTYEQEPKKVITPRPDFVSQLAAAKKKRRIQSMDNDEYATQPSQRPATPIIVQPPRKPQVLPYQQPTTEEARHQLEEDLQQEAALLTVSVQNDLDSVQKMEQRMVDITTLISQFSNLVSEQQEEIWQIHEAAQNTKDNMEKGQDHLVDATERTKRSKHYTAWAVVGMALILLFFHTLKS
jgi:hypothetical protein